MALDLFHILPGLDISNEGLTSNVNILQGTGAPGDAGNPSDELAWQNAAPVGSLYLRNDVNPTTGEQYLQVYWKHTAGSGTNKWAIGASKAYVDSIAQGLSWREPALLMVDTANSNSPYTLANVVTDANADDAIDGTTIAAGDRVVLRNLTGGTPNIYVVGGSTGNWTFTEDPTNTLTDGDAVLILDGAHQDEQWVWDADTENGGANPQWVQFGGSSSTAELGFIRDFIGKDAPGNGLPNYASNDIVVDGLSLESEIGRLDDAVGTLTFTTPDVLTSYSDTFPTTPAVSDITTNLQALDDTYGNGSITNIGNFYALSDEMQWNTNGTLTLTDAFNALNNAIGDRDYTGNILTDGQSITDSLEEIDVTVGDIDNSSAYTGGGGGTDGYLSNVNIANNSIQQTFDSFNQFLGDINSTTLQIGPTSIPTGTPTDLENGDLLETGATEVKWLLQYRDSAVAGRRRAVEIHALSDGSGNVDFNVASILRTGTAITGVTITVSIVSGAWAVTVNSTTTALTAVLKRVSYSYMA
jgi:hypothetical protein